MDRTCLLALAALACVLTFFWCCCAEQAAAAAALYGDQAPPIPRRPPLPPDARLDGENLTRAIFDLEVQGAADLEAAADAVGPPVPDVSGVTDVDDVIQARLQDQEQQLPAEGPLVERTKVREIAQTAMDASIAAVEPAAPKFQPMEDMLPSRVWSPVFVGCPPFFVESNCEFYKPEPRLYVDDLSELLYARTLQQGQVNLIEPTQARQTYAQFLMEGVRSKKDPYTRASMTNSTSFGACEALQKRTPEFVVW